MTEEILQIMKKKKSEKQDPVRHDYLNKEVRKGCTEAKENRAYNHLKEIELVKKDALKMYAKVKQLTNKEMFKNKDGV